MALKQNIQVNTRVLMLTAIWKRLFNEMNLKEIDLEGVTVQIEDGLN